MLDMENPKWLPYAMEGSLLESWGGRLSCVASLVAHGHLSNITT